MTRTSLNIDTSTRDILKGVGKKTETYDDLILRLVKESKELEKIKRDNK